MLQLTTFNTINTTSDSAATTVPVIATLPITMPAANSEKAPVSKTAKASTAKTAKAPAAKTAKASAVDTLKDSTADTTKAPAAKTTKAPAAKTAKTSTANTTKAPARITKKQAKIDLQNTITSVLATGDAIAIKHDDYFDTYITKGNEALSELLTEIMAFAETVFASTNFEEVIKAIRKKLKDSYDIRVQKNSNNIAIIVRYITRTNRKNAHVYSRAIKLAFDAGKTSAELANFIDENGGISKIREKNVNAAAVELKDKIKHGVIYYTHCLLKDLSENNVIATFKVDEKRSVELNEMARGGHFKYMICRNIGRNEYAVIDAVGQVDDEFEEKIFYKYFHYHYNMYIRCRGEEAADTEFQKRMHDNINKWNKVRKAKGCNLLDFYGFEIKNEKNAKDHNEIKELDLIDSAENCLEESSCL